VKDLYDEKAMLDNEAVKFYPIYSWPEKYCLDITATGTRLVIAPVSVCQLLEITVC
jgi:hypothetical protein